MNGGKNTNTKNRAAFTPPYPVVFYLVDPLHTVFKSRSSNAVRSTTFLREGDTIIVTKLNRFCRTVKSGLDIIDTIIKKKARMHILNMGLVENTPMGNLILTMLLAFAQFERDMIIERTQSGKAIARTKEGFKEGRPPKYSKVQMDHALSLLGEYSYKQVARMTNISVSTLLRNKRKLDNKGT